MKAETLQLLREIGKDIKIPETKLVFSKKKILEIMNKGSKKLSDESLELLDKLDQREVKLIGSEFKIKKYLVIGTNLIVYDSFVEEVDADA